MSWTSLSICGNVWTCHCRLSSLRSDCQFCCGEHNPKFHLLSAIRGKETQMSNKVRTSRSENVGPLLHGMPFEFGTQGSIQFFRESHDIVPRWVGIGIGDVFSGGAKPGEGMRPHWVKPVLPPCHGLVVVTEDWGLGRGTRMGWSGRLIATVRLAYFAYWP